MDIHVYMLRTPSVTSSVARWQTPVHTNTGSDRAPTITVTRGVPPPRLCRDTFTHNIPQDSHTRSRCYTCCQQHADTLSWSLLTQPPTVSRLRLTTHVVHTRGHLHWEAQPPPPSCSQGFDVLAYVEVYGFGFSSILEISCNLLLIWLMSAVSVFTFSLASWAFLPTMEMSRLASTRSCRTVLQP